MLSTLREPRRRGSRGFALLLLLLVASCSPTADPDPPVEVADAAVDAEVAALFERLLDAARRDPQSGTARGQLAMAYDANGLKEEALRSYDQAIARTPDEARWYYQSAFVLSELGDFTEAVARLDSTIRRDPEYPPTYWRRGQFQFAQGDFDAAEQSFREAIERQPRHPAGPVGLARIHLQRKEPEKAEELLENTLANLSRTQFLGYLHYLLGTAYRQQGRLDEARSELAAGRRGRPLWRDNWRREVDEYRVSFHGRLRGTSLMLEMGRSAEAIPLLEELLAQNRTDRSLLDQLSRAYFNVGRVDDARRTLEASVGHRPDDDRAYRNLSLVVMTQGDLESAIRYARHVVELNPNVSGGWVNLGTILAQAGRGPAALEAYRSALERDPNAAEALQKAGSLAGSLGFWKESHEFFTRLLSRNPSHREGLLARAKAAEALDRPDDARRDREAAARLGGDE